MDEDKEENDWRGKMTKAEQKQSKSKSSIRFFG